MRKKQFKWNRDKKANFVSKDFIRKANDLLRKMNCPYVRDKSTLSACANEIYNELNDKKENRKILFRDLKEKRIYTRFLSLIDVPNNVYRSFITNS